MSILHTKFLIHWTGKDFHKPLTRALDDKLRDKYIERLTNTLDKGFYMQPGTENIYDLDGNSIKPTISRVCFTEIKLSLAKQHAKTLGRLGIGVDRRFALNRYGNPVFYVLSGKSNIMVNARKVSEFLKKQNNEVSQEFEILLAYFKNMNEKGSQKLKFYDELEWRITHLRRLDKDYLETEDEDNYIYRVKLTKNDVKLIVFPDKKTKIKAFSNNDFIKLIDKPLCVTLDDCEHF